MKLADISIKRPVFATMIIGALVVLGIFSYPQIGVDLMPKVDFPVITVTTIYPGASPSVIEKKVIDKIEEAVNTISGVDILRSVSLENVGQVIVQFDLKRKSNNAAQDIRDKISSIQRELPSGVELPTVQKFDIGALPVMTISLAGAKSMRELSDIAKTLKEKIQKVSGVGGITLVGQREREIHILLKRNRLNAFGLVGNDVVRALQAGNLEIPGGRLSDSRTEISVKMKGEVMNLEQLRDIVITNIMGRFIKIRDVAEIRDTLKEARSSSALNGKPAIALIVRKQSGINTVAIATKVRAALEELRKTLPKSIRMAIPTDNAIYIQRSISDVQIDLFFGGLLTVLIIFFFLHDFRSTFISAVAIPTSVIATFTFVRFMDFSFNNLTMLALTLSIGILIDDAIVVLENIHRHLTEEGKDPYTAASEGTAEIGLAVMASTFTIAAVFLPVAFMKGLLGRFFYEFGMTISFAILVSMLVSFTLTPMLSSILLKVDHKPKNFVFRGIDIFLDWIDGVYARLIGLALGFRWSTLLIAISLLVASFFLIPFIGVEFVPKEDRAEFAVYAELPEGTNMETTRRFCEKLTKVIKLAPEVKDTLVTVGAGSRGKVNLGQIEVKLVKRHDRTKSQFQLASEARKRLSKLKGGKITVQRIDPMSSGSGFRSQQIQFNIRGTDFKVIAKAARDLLAELKKHKGYVDLDYSFRGGKAEYAVIPNRKRAAFLEVPLASIGMALRTQLRGLKIGEFQDKQNRIDIRLKLQKDQRKQLNDLRQIKVRNIKGKLIELGNLVDIRKEAGFGQIERQERQRQITVLANLEGLALGAGMALVEKLAKKVVPKTLDTSWAGQGKIMQDSLGHMLGALILAAIFIYMILASQFNSFIHPFTIMTSLPFSFIGVFVSLFLTGMSINIYNMIGMIMLMGLVTKTAILLVDYANTLRERGTNINEALIQAGRTRLRPILMTTIATIVGMLPVALGFSEGGEARAPMAVSVIGGLITSTLLTLIVVPVVYHLFDRSKDNTPVNEEEMSLSHDT